MTDNINESNPVNAESVPNTTSSNVTTWQLNALTTALGDLSLTVSDSLSVGRGSDNDVVLGSKEISRNHAVLSVLNAELYVKDLDSSNGTFVNDQRIEGNKSVLLKADDKLGFASLDFQVMALVADKPERTATNLVAEQEEPASKEPEDIVGSVQEDFETNNTPSVQPVSESSVPPAAVEEAIAERPPSTVEPVSTDANPEPVVKETIIGEVLSASAGAAAMSAAPVEEDIMPSTPESTATPSMTATEETVLTNDKSQEPVIEESVIKTPAAEEPVIEEPVIEEPIAKAPVVEEPDHQESTVSPEHDKTTTTTLQEEADPDVLRAKQAATAQFSGTANLGQGRDLGTAGNNAMNQAIDNPTNNAQGEKKASGGWFIWVFIAILIIGIALWLFNMGGA